MSDDLKDILAGLGVMRRTTALELHGPKIALLILLWKLEVIGARRLSFSYGQLLANPNFKEPPNSIALSVVSLSREYIQFCPKRLADKDLKPR